MSKATSRSTARGGFQLALVADKVGDQTADQVAGATNLVRRQVCQQRGHIRREPLDLPVPLFKWPKQV
jgi:hypothetical protein